MPIQAASECRLRYSQANGPFTKTLTDPAKRQHAAIRTVALLFFVSRPAAIARLVIAVVVNPIQGQPDWGLSHIFQEY